VHFQKLEAESIQIIREAVVERERPVMRYSIGKDSAGMLQLALRAFAPATILVETNSDLPSRSAAAIICGGTGCRWHQRCQSNAQNLERGVYGIGTQR
jgi:hypothetical protein